jgi:hypothetical protein
MEDQSDSSEREFNEEEFKKWLQIGIDNGWCSDVVCSTHNGIPETEAEGELWEQGYDPCIWGIRAWIPT